MTHWHPDLPFCALILALMILAFIPEMMEGVHKYRRGRELERQITAEQGARDFLDRQWKESHGG
jgi:hypothetical protein